MKRVLSVTGLLTFYFSKLKTKKEKMEHPTQTLRKEKAACEV